MPDKVVQEMRKIYGLTWPTLIVFSITVLLIAVAVYKLYAMAIAQMGQ
jgi:hypothetical protein